MAAFSLVSGDNTGADSVGNITFSKIRIFFTGYLIKSVLLIYHSMLVTKPVNFFFFFLPWPFYLLVKSPGHKEYIYHQGIIKVLFDISRETDYIFSFHETLKNLCLSVMPRNLQLLTTFQPPKLDYWILQLGEISTF